MDLSLLKELCAVHAPSGDELNMKNFLINYINEHSSSWENDFELIEGDEFQDCFLLKFGNPKTAIFAHMDSVGFTVSYNNKLVKIGGPKANIGSVLTGEDSLGRIEGKLVFEKDEDGIESFKIDFDRNIERGTSLVYAMNFIQDEENIQSCYLDDRLGIWTALKVCETLKDGIVAFSAWEEVGGGSVGYLAAYMYNQFKVKQALIADITWVTEGVSAGSGVAISMRDSGIPRQAYVRQIIALAKQSGVQYQIEVESAGGSDGNALQRSPFPFDWCFIGAPEKNVHQENEIVALSDIKAMLHLYQFLMNKL